MTPFALLLGEVGRGPQGAEQFAAVVGGPVVRRGRGRRCS